MRYAILLFLAFPATALAQRNGGRNGTPVPGLAGQGGNAPEAIVAPNVPMLAGLPHAVKVGFTVYVSAMVPVDSAGNLVGAGDLAAQARQALANLSSVMTAAHGVPGDVVRLTIYIKDLSAADVATVRGIVLDGLDRAVPPALTVVGVAALAEPGMRVMLDATAQLRSVFPDRSRTTGGH
ncbi:MAG TPA: RidA family protein [Gemmatimonadales bacterium]|jgi:enamine deaminase RidA (YjgF/YER057c/UK114 family)|nr:RidA family protein [Gemmatimonadales bacterium]